MATDPNVLTLPLQYMIPTDVLTDGRSLAALDWPPGLTAFGNEWKAIPNPTSLGTAHWRPHVLGADECATVTAWARALPELDLSGQAAPAAHLGSHMRWIEPREENHWLYHRIGALMAQVNRQFGFTLAGLSEALLYVEYGPGSHWHWRMDLGSGIASLRKLAAVIQLSDPSEYDGGTLSFVGLGTMDEVRQHGSATFHPAYLGHEMTPVTRGTRRVLLAWASGPAFR
ncbi:2OG-Fe(II) oxygenase [Ramlibacter humi]|uniref:Uncharacterized protein n=1 Tax=Ramlibacter humi TaxID=2530451 RepID=A0A4Z0C980_9BURK|nr:2OG-Fe(II) oxygenase [Ramlibacter humi]TFZ08173.1 hypothetical protein EZ216_03150 [Ramlibacter humi]